jgi:hypothetical protein
MARSLVVWFYIECLGKCVHCVSVSLQGKKGVPLVIGIFEIRATLLGIRGEFVKELLSFFELSRLEER